MECYDHNDTESVIIQIMCLKNRILLWFISFSCSIAVLNAEFKLTIIHTNDMHSRIEEINARTGKCDKTKANDPCYGGFARVAHEAARIKKETKNTLFLNAGDTYQGTPLHTFFKYKMLVPLMKKLKIDVMSLGNHEFDDGIAGLAPYLQQVGIPVVACNIDTTNEPSLTNQTLLKEYVILEVASVKIAVIGYILPDTKFLSSTGNVVFKDEVKMIKKYALEAKTTHQAKLVFAIGHSGIEIDQKIAKEVPEVDVVVGGHTDTFLYTGTIPDRETSYGPYPLNVTQTKDGKVVPVVQAYGYTKYLGKLDLVWDDDYKLISATGNPILLDSSVDKDQEVEKEILTWTKDLDKKLAMKKGSTRVYLNGDCRFYECNVGNFITDAIANYVVKETDVKKKSKWTDAPIAILNGGSFRTSIKRTESVTFGSILTMLPFTKQLVRLNMLGSVLMKALHRSIERYDVARKLGRGEFLQMSGMKVRYVQLENGSLAVDRAYVLCGDCHVPKYSTLDEKKNYTVVTTSFVADGGDGFYMFKNETIREHTYEKDDLTVVASYLELMSPIYPAEEGRVIIPKVLTQLKKEEEVVESEKTKKQEESVKQNELPNGGTGASMTLSAA